eukprot:gnl/Trimastix_PCT/1179.p1 GENE.gnl/Trimastix_PCT/1179~~gnl/Trimastix_PCT/1179.p1  ORF type:complete len:169 (+),score=29.09 gnl/Trimastix_PCT/1179:39-509(+)
MSLPYHEINRQKNPVSVHSYFSGMKTVLLLVAAIAVFACTVQAGITVDGKILNQTNKTLTLIQHHLDDGHWETNPPKTIEPFGTGHFSAHTGAFAGAVVGWMDYSLTRVPGTFYMHFKDEAVGVNIYHQKAPQGYRASHEGGEGYEAHVTFMLQPQ